MKFFLNMNRETIGMEYAQYCPAIPRAKIAVIADAPAKASRPRHKAVNAAIQTPFTGVLVYGLIL